MNISIIEDHKIFAEILKTSLINCEFVSNVSIYQDFEKFQSHISVLPNDLLITDMFLEDTTGFEVIAFCRKLKSKKDLPILVLTSLSDTEYVKEAIALGANGYISKDASFLELLDAIKQVIRNRERFFLGSDIKKLIIGLPGNNGGPVSLSPLEFRILKLLCAGKTIREISAELDFHSTTMNNFKKQIMRKMNVDKMQDLIVKAVKNGLYSPS